MYKRHYVATWSIAVDNLISRHNTITDANNTPISEATAHVNVPKRRYLSTADAHK